MTTSRKTYIAELVGIQKPTDCYGIKNIEAASSDEAIAKARDWALSHKGMIGNAIMLKLKKQHTPWGVYHEPIALP
jgi:hypothetical protein